MPHQAKRFCIMSNALFSKAVAIATYYDTWAGDLPCALIPFATKRNGAKVLRYRWVSDRGSVVGGYASAFQTPKGGVVAASRHHGFKDVRELSAAV
jgi:hypothetical protein